MASLTFALSATGTTRRRKYSRFSHRASSEMGPSSVGGASRSSSASKLVTIEPPRDFVYALVRSQLKSVIHS